MSITYRICVMDPDGETVALEEDTDDERFAARRLRFHARRHWEQGHAPGTSVPYLIEVNDTTGIGDIWANRCAHYEGKAQQLCESGMQDL